MKGAGVRTAARAPCLVVVGRYVPGTGLTRVLTSLLSPLAERWQIEVAGVGFEAAAPISTNGIRIHPTDASGRDAFATHAAAKLAQELEPDAILCFNDLWIMPRYVKCLRPVSHRSKLVAYVPLDGNLIAHGGEPVDAELARPLLGFDLIVVYTEWSRQQVAAAWDRLGADHRPEIVVVGHGVDWKLFTPDPALLESGFAPSGRLPARRRALPRLEEPEGAFVVLNASRPALRKRLDLTIEGFARFAAGKPPGVRLCLHQAITDAATTQEQRHRIGQLGLGPRLVASSTQTGVLSDTRLADLYRACDIGLNTSMGEGWGLASFEHAATGGAQVVPDHSACADLWDRHAELIPAMRRTIPRFSPLELAEVTPDGVANVLEHIYADPDRLRRPLSRSVRSGSRSRAELGCSGHTVAGHPATVDALDGNATAANDATC